jgi:Flp pilus assembly protein TadG
MGSRRRSRRRGQAMVEFALVLPIFLLVLAGILDFGFMLYNRMTVINAAREGAHAAIIVPNYNDIPTVVQGAVIANAARGGITLTGADVAVSCSQTSTGVVAPPACSWATAVPGDSVIVTVSYTYHSFFPLYFGTSFNLSSTVQMVVG